MAIFLPVTDIPGFKGIRIVQKQLAPRSLAGAYFARQGVLLCTEWHCLWSLPCLASA